MVWKLLLKNRIKAGLLTKHSFQSKIKDLGGKVSLGAKITEGARKRKKKIKSQNI